MPRNRNKRNKKRDRSPSLEPPDEKPDFLRGYVSDDHIVLLGAENADASIQAQPLILPIEAINYLLLVSTEGKKYIYKAGLTDGIVLFIHNSQGPVDFAEMVYPGELPDADEDPWERKSHRRRHSRSS